MKTAAPPYTVSLDPETARTSSCPYCRLPLRTGDSAGMHGGRALHLDCYLTVVRAGEELLAYLKRRTGAEFCVTCVVTATAVTFEEVTLAQGWLRARAGTRVEMGSCSACGGRRMTLAFLASSPVPAAR